MYRSIAVPLDGSTLGEHALPVALTVARAAGAGLQLVHVQEPPMPPTEIHAAAALTGALTGEAERLSAQISERYLNDMLERVAKIAGMRPSAALLNGDVADTLSRYVGETGADLIVMSTHGRGVIGRLLLGSVAQSVVRHAPVPVLLVRPPEGEPDLARPWSCAHILLPLDGSEFAEQVIGHAEALARLFGAACTLVTVIEPLLATASPLGPEVGAPVTEALYQPQDVARDAAAYLERVAQRLRRSGIEVRTEVLSHRQPAHTILNFAKRNAVDLIAMCTHSRPALSRLVVGSVAEGVVHAASMPVLMLRPTGE